MGRVERLAFMSARPVDCLLTEQKPTSTITMQRKHIWTARKRMGRLNLAREAWQGGSSRLSSNWEPVTLKHL